MLSLWIVERLIKPDRSTSTSLPVLLRTSETLRPYVALYVSTLLMAQISFRKAACAYGLKPRWVVQDMLVVLEGTEKKFKELEASYLEAEAAADRARIREQQVHTRCPFSFRATLRVIIG